MRMRPLVVLCKTADESFGIASLRAERTAMRLALSPARSNRATSDFCLATNPDIERAMPRTLIAELPEVSCISLIARLWPSMRRRQAATGSVRAARRLS